MLKCHAPRRVSLFTVGFMPALRGSGKTGRSALVSEAIVSRGLCSTCRHVPSCTYQRDPKRPVFNCEEFEIETDEPVRVSGRDAVSSGPSPESDSDGDDFARYKGLCGNCEERKSCTFPKPEGGVWHCEEYR